MGEKALEWLYFLLESTVSPLPTLSWEPSVPNCSLVPRAQNQPGGGLCSHSRGYPTPPVVLYEFCLLLKRAWPALDKLGEGPGALRDGNSGPTASSDLEHPFVWRHLRNQGQDPCFPDRETEVERRGAADAVGPDGVGPWLLSGLIHGGLTRLMLNQGWEKLPFPPSSFSDKHGDYDGSQPVPKSLSSV